MIVKICDRCQREAEELTEFKASGYGFGRLMVQSVAPGPELCPPCEIEVDSALHLGYRRLFDAVIPPTTSP
jgi:hypothetical protein